MIILKILFLIVISRILTEILHRRRYIFFNLEKDLYTESNYK